MPAPMPVCLTAALECLKRGWSVLPLCPPDHRGVSGQHEQQCRRPGREPLCDAKAYHERLPREVELRLLWQRSPAAGVGAALGRVSGLVGVEAVGTAGEAQLTETADGDLPTTLEWLTNDGGRVLLYALPSGVRLPPRRPDDDAAREGLRCLATGAHVVLPPTPGYEWVGGHAPGDLTAAPAPVWLLERLGAEPDGGCKSPVEDSKAEGSRPPPAGARPAVCTAADLMSQEFADLRWALPGLIPEGGTILAGRPKTGKSWLTLGLALAVAGGAPALGGVAAAGEVLYLALEDGPRRLRRRLDKMLRTLGTAAPAALHLATTWPRVGQGGLQRVDEWLHAHPAARLVVVDTLARVRDRRGEGGVYEEDYRTLAALKDLGDRYACAVVVVHHTRKGDSDDPLESIAGTLGLSGAADCVLVLRHQRQSEEGRLFVTGRDVDEREVTLRWDAERCLWSREEADDGLTTEQRAVVAAMRTRAEPVTPADLVPLLRKNKDALKQLRRRMADDYGVIRHGTRRGTYELRPEA